MGSIHVPRVDLTGDTSPGGRTTASCNICQICGHSLAGQAGCNHQSCLRCPHARLSRDYSAFLLGRMDKPSTCKLCMLCTTSLVSVRRRYECEAKLHESYLKTQKLLLNSSQDTISNLPYTSWHGMHLLQFLTGLQHSASLCDVHITADGGQVIKVHMIIMLAFTNLFREKLLYKPDPDDSRIHQMAVEFSASTVQAVVDYIYHGVIVIPPGQLTPVRHLAEAWGLTHLVQALEEKECASDLLDSSVEIIGNVRDCNQRPSNITVKEEVKPSLKSEDCSTLCSPLRQTCSGPGQQMRSLQSDEDASPAKRKSSVPPFVCPYYWRLQAKRYCLDEKYACAQVVVEDVGLCRKKRFQIRGKEGMKSTSHNINSSLALKNSQSESSFVGSSKVVGVRVGSQSVACQTDSFGTPQIDTPTACDATHCLEMVSPSVQPSCTPASSLSASKSSKSLKGEADNRYKMRRTSGCRTVIGGRQADVQLRPCSVMLAPLEVNQGDDEQRKSFASCCDDVNVTVKKSKSYAEIRKFRILAASTTTEVVENAATTRNSQISACVATKSKLKARSSRRPIRKREPVGISSHQGRVSTDAPSTHQSRSHFTPQRRSQSSSQWRVRFTSQQRTKITLQRQPVLLAHNSLSFSRQLRPRSRRSTICFARKSPRSCTKVTSYAECASLDNSVDDAKTECVSMSGGDAAIHESRSATATSDSKHRTLPASVTSVDDECASISSNVSDSNSVVSGTTELVSTSKDIGSCSDVNMPVCRSGHATWSPVSTTSLSMPKRTASPVCSPVISSCSGAMTSLTASTGTSATSTLAALTASLNLRRNTQAPACTPSPEIGEFRVLATSSTTAVVGDVAKTWNSPISASPAAHESHGLTALGQPSNFHSSSTAPVASIDSVCDLGGVSLPSSSTVTPSYPAVARATVAVTSSSGMSSHVLASAAAASTASTPSTTSCLHPATNVTSAAPPVNHKSTFAKPRPKSCLVSDKATSTITAPKLARTTKTKSSTGTSAALFVNRRTSPDCPVNAEKPQRTVIESRMEDRASHQSSPVSGSRTLAKIANNVDLDIKAKPNSINVTQVSVSGLTTPTGVSVPSCRVETVLTSNSINSQSVAQSSASTSANLHVVESGRLDALSSADVCLSSSYTTATSSAMCRATSTEVARHMALVAAEEGPRDSPSSTTQPSASYSATAVSPVTAVSLHSGSLGQATALLLSPASNVVSQLPAFPLVTSVSISPNERTSYSLPHMSGSSAGGVGMNQPSSGMLCVSQANIHASSSSNLIVRNVESVNASGLTSTIQLHAGLAAGPDRPSCQIVSEANRQKEGLKRRKLRQIQPRPSLSSPVQNIISLSSCPVSSHSVDTSEAGITDQASAQSTADTAMTGMDTNPAQAAFLLPGASFPSQSLAPMSQPFQQPLILNNDSQSQMLAQPTACAVESGQQPFIGSVDTANQSLFDNSSLMSGGSLMNQMVVPGGFQNFSSVLPFSFAPPLNQSMPFVVPQQASVIMPCQDGSISGVFNSPFGSLPPSSAPSQFLGSTIFSENMASAPVVLSVSPGGNYQATQLPDNFQQVALRVQEGDASNTSFIAAGGNISGIDPSALAPGVINQYVQAPTLPVMANQSNLGQPGMTPFLDQTGGSAQLIQGQQSMPYLASSAHNTSCQGSSVYLSDPAEITSNPQLVGSNQWNAVMPANVAPANIPGMAVDGTAVGGTAAVGEINPLVIAPVSGYQVEGIGETGDFDMMSHSSIQRSDDMSFQRQQSSESHRVNQIGQMTHCKVTRPAVQSPTVSSDTPADVMVPFSYPETTSDT